MDLTADLYEGVKWSSRQALDYSPAQAHVLRAARPPSAFNEEIGACRWYSGELLSQ